MSLRRDRQCNALFDSPAVAASGGRCQTQPSVISIP
jgi:hypothetical protein